MAFMVARAWKADGGLGWLVKIMGYARGFLRESISFFHLAENRILFHAGICLWRVYNAHRACWEIVSFRGGGRGWRQYGNIWKEE